MWALKGLKPHLRRILAWLLLSIPLAAAAAQELALSSQEQAWLEAHPSIRVGVMDDWPPFDFVDEQGRARGIGVDLIQRLNGLLGGGLVVVPGPWLELKAQVGSGEIDALMDITPRPDREQRFDFTTPYLDVPHVIVAPKGAVWLDSE